MDGGACILICENNIITCPCSLGNSLIFKYLALLIARQININPSSMRFLPTADEDKIKLINDEGIESVKLNVSLYQATMDFNKQQKSKIKNKLLIGIGSVVKALLDTHGDGNLEQQADMKVGLVFHANSKNKEISSEQLNELGKTFINDNEDGYTIKTLAGNTITYDDLKIKKPIKIDRNGKTIDRSSAWNVMKIYFTELLERGIMSK